MIKINIPYTSLDEQNKIAELLLATEKLFTLHQRKLEVLNKLKKAMLQNMFV